jgi:hypothetical protein
MARPQQSWAQWAYTGRQAGRQAQCGRERERERGGLAQRRGRLCVGLGERGFGLALRCEAEKGRTERSREAANSNVALGRVGPGPGWG